MMQERLDSMFRQERSQAGALPSFRVAIEMWTPFVLLFRFEQEPPDIPCPSILVGTPFSIVLLFCFYLGTCSSEHGVRDLDRPRVQGWVCLSSGKLSS